MENKDYLLLKWGTVKAWDFRSTDCESFQLLEKYKKDMPLSCATHHPDKDKKQLLCKIIDNLDGEIQNEWTGDFLTKEEAKKYVLEYD